MHDIDFLPIEYRQKHQRQQSQPWQIVVSIAIMAMIAGAAITQHAGRRYVQKQLTAVESAYKTAQQLQYQLTEIKKRLEQVGADAELNTYLRHPWPRTQLLAALLAPLPKEITFLQLQIMRETTASAPFGGMRPTVDLKADEEKLRSMTPAQRDLMKLRVRTDPLRTIVQLSGMTTESAALHRYLDELDKKSIFEQAELNNVNSVEKNAGGSAVQFRAVLMVQPGYGQSGGPGKPVKKLASAIERGTLSEGNAPKKMAKGVGTPP
jgi:hypothetical protein